jgi:hypothetical protein
MKVISPRYQFDGLHQNGPIYRPVLFGTKPTDNCVVLFPGVIV